ncbi:hypothetical protein ACGCUP_07230 [Eubacteriales bacterium KG125]
MTKQDIKDFLAFRSKFTKREWNSLMQTIHFKENEKADKIKLDDLDINEIVERLSKNI